MSCVRAIESRRQSMAVLLLVLVLLALSQPACPTEYEVSVSSTVLRGSGSTLGVSVSGPVQNGTHFLAMYTADANLWSTAANP